MKHFLITRFNLRVPEWRRTDKNNILTLDDAWLEHRFDLFNKHTVPSVWNQTFKDFMWIVLFDTDTPIRWVHIINGYKMFTPLYLTKNWLVELQSLLPNQWIATTRLDNDDSIEPTFMATIHAAIRQKKEFLNIPMGWITNGKKRITDHRANPFITFVEQGNRSVYFTPHGVAMGKYAPIRQISTLRLWTQVIHERNYCND